MFLCRSFILLLGALMVTILAPGDALAEKYVIDASHSSVQFSIRHLVSRTSGRFNDFSGTIEYDEKRPEATEVEATIQVASIDTDSDKRDAHLKSPDFFDVGKYPTITFKSTRAEKRGDKLLITGDLTMHGVKKAVQLPVEILGTGTNPFTKKPQAGFASETTLKRSDYGVNNWTDEIGVLGDEVKVSLTIEANVKI